MFRGRLNSTVSPLTVLMLATIIVSVRTLVRSGPASEPISRTFTRGTLAHGSALAAFGRAAFASRAPLANTEETRSRWIIA